MSDTMEEVKVPFTVCFMPPKQPANSLVPPSPTPNEPLEKLSMAFSFYISLEQLFNEVGNAYDKACSAEKRAGGYISHLEDPWGGKLIAPTPIINAYDRNTPRQGRIIYVRQNAVDRECSIPVGSILRPEGFQKRTLNDLTPSQQESMKRRRQQESRYGAAVDELSADMPVMSKEAAEAGAQNHVDEEEEQEQRRDDDGFAVPAIPRRILPPRRRRTTATQEESQATVLVEDSQVDTTNAQPRTSAAALRQRYSLPSVRQDSTPANHSSPAEDAAARASTAAAQPRAQQPSRARQSPVVQVSRPSSLTRRTQSELPTPDTNEEEQSSQEAPTSAQRPPSSRAPPSERTPRFITGRLSTATDPTSDIAESDPIEDVDDTLLDASQDVEDADYDPGQAAQTRGRTRSRSVESIPQRRETSDAVDQPGSQPAPSGSAFEELRSSQSRQTSASRSGSAKKWSKEEDIAFLRGMKKGLKVHQILIYYDIDRTEPAARNRKRALEKMFPDGHVQEGHEYWEGVNAAEDEARALPSSQKQPWSQNDIATLRKAIAEGFDKIEIRDKYFGSRSGESVAKKIKEFLPGVEKCEKTKADFPQNDWSIHFNLKLRRAMKERMEEETAWKTWFSSLKLENVRNKMSAYRNQLGGSTTAQEDQSLETASQPPPASPTLQDTQPSPRVSPALAVVSNESVAARQSPPGSPKDTPSATLLETRVSPRMSQASVGALVESAPAPEIEQPASSDATLSVALPETQLSPRVSLAPADVSKERAASPSVFVSADEQRSVRSFMANAPGEQLVQELEQSVTSTDSQPQIQSQPYAQVEPVVKPPYDLRTPLGPPDEKGMVFIGRPEFPVKVHTITVEKQWCDRQLWEETARMERETPQFLQDAFELRKVSTQCYIAMSAGDQEERARLYAKEKRMARELRIARGLPSRRQRRQTNRLALDGEAAEPADEDVIREDDESDDDDYDDDFMEDEDEDDDMSGFPIIEGPEYPNGVDRNRVIEEIADADDDDAGALPTSPPPEPEEATTAPTDKDLQDLVQSGDIDMYDDASHFITTTTGPDPLGHNSPAVRLTPMELAAPPKPKKRKRVTADGTDDAAKKKRSRKKRKTRKSRHASDQQEPSAEPQPRGRKVTPIGETQSTETPVEMQQPRRGGPLSALGRALGWEPHIPPAPRPRPQRQGPSFELPYDNDAEDSSSDGSDSDEE